jgi:hypothetical protein
MKRFGLFICASAMAVMAASPAAATVTITGGTPSSFTVDYNGNVALTPIAGLTASILFNFLNTSGSTYNFSYTLTNTSSAPVAGSRVSGFAIDTTPNIQTATASGLFTNAVAGSYPNGVGNVELCLTANTCQGGGNGGVTMGNSGMGTFSLTFAAPQSSITIDRFLVRYQSIAGVNAGESGTGEGMVRSPVPEPATWAMLIVGFAW